MEIGIAFDLKSEVQAANGGLVSAAADDQFEEYDSEETIDAIARALEANGYKARRLGGGRRFMEALLQNPPDLVFNIAEGFGSRSREAHVPAIAETLRVPITHSDPLTLAVSLDKAMAKSVVAAAGVPTPRSVVIDRPSQSVDLPFGFPVVAKPLFEGSSMGIRRSSRATNARSLREEVERLIGHYQQPVLVEEFCPGPELTVGVLGTGMDAKVIAPMEILPRRANPEEFIYSIEAKRNWREEVEYKVPPDREPSFLKKVEAVALGAHRALGCRDVSRVDIRTGIDGEPKFLEVNPLPGINPNTGDIVILSGRSGISYEELIGRIVSGARARYGL